MSMMEWAKREHLREKEEISQRVSGIMAVLAMIVLLRRLRAFVEMVTAVLVSALQRGSLID